jgi:hypothetical protein
MAAFPSHPCRQWVLLHAGPLGISGDTLRIHLRLHLITHPVDTIIIRGALTTDGLLILVTPISGHLTHVTTIIAILLLLPPIKTITTTTMSTHTTMAWTFQLSAENETSTPTAINVPAIFRILHPCLLKSSLLP